MSLAYSQLPPGPSLIPYRLTPGSLVLIISGFRIHVDGPSGTLHTQVLVRLWSSAVPPLSTAIIQLDRDEKESYGRGNEHPPSCLLSVPVFASRSSNITQAMLLHSGSGSSFL